MDNAENYISRIIGSLENSELDQPELRLLNRVVYRLGAHLQSDRVNLVVVKILTDALRERLREYEDTEKNIDKLEYFAAQKAKGYPKNLASEDKLANYIQEGYAYQVTWQLEKACARWDQAWNLIKEMTVSEISSVRDFDKANPNLDEFVQNLAHDYEHELRNVGFDQPEYFQRRIEFVDEFFDTFPADEEDPDFLLNFYRAKAESFWYLGERDQAEKLYAELTELLPDEVWGYIGWADHYWLDKNGPPEYERAEKLLKRALSNPKINDRMYGLERLRDLYHEWGKPQKAEEIAARLKKMI